MKKNIIVLILLSIFVGCSKSPKVDKDHIYNDLFIRFTNNEYIYLEYGSDFQVDSIVVETNGTVTFPDSIDTTQPGEYSLIYKVSSIEYPEIEKQYTITVLVSDNDIFWQYQKFICSNAEYFYFKNFKDNAISFVLNPDGNSVEGFNFTIGNGDPDKAIYIGYFSLVKENVYSFSGGTFYDKYVYLEDKPSFANEIDGYFKLEDNKLYFITDILSLEEMLDYSSNNYCKLEQ